MRLSGMKKRLGDMLVDVGVITPEQLATALDIQKRDGGKLGAVLSHMGVINEEVMLAFLGKQCGVSYVSLAEYGDIAPAVIRSIPETVVRAQQLVPISRDGAVLTVAMSDPFNIFAIDDIKLMTGCDVQVVISSAADIRQAIERYYTTGDSGDPLLPSGVVLAGLSPDAEKELFARFLANLLSLQASHIYLDPRSDGVRVKFRRDGQLHERPPLPRAVMETFIPRLKVMAGISATEAIAPIESRMRARVNDADREITVSCIPTVTGERIVLRVADPADFSRDLALLGFEPEVLSIYRAAIEAGRGLVIVSGPLSSGKTTTIYSTIRHQALQGRDIVTIEQPVEHLLSGVSQVQIQGDSWKALDADMRVFLRQNPDMLVLSDVPDQAAARAAVQAALAGSLVVVGMIARSAIEALMRFVALSGDPYLSSAATVLALNQRIVRAICPDCKSGYAVARGAIRTLGVNDPAGDGERITLWRGGGCPRCSMTGYRGTVAVFEALSVNDPIKAALIDRTAGERAVRDAAVAAGGISLADAAWRKVRAGVTTVEEMLRVLRN